MKVDNLQYIPNYLEFKKFINSLSNCKIEELKELGMIAVVRKNKQDKFCIDFELCDVLGFHPIKLGVFKGKDTVLFKYKDS